MDQYLPMDLWLRVFIQWKRTVDYSLLYTHSQQNCNELTRMGVKTALRYTKKNDSKPVDEEGHSSLSDLPTSRNSYANITLIESKLSVVFNRKMANNTFIIVVSFPIQFDSKPYSKCWFICILSISWATMQCHPFQGFVPIYIWYHNLLAEQCKQYWKVMVSSFFKCLPSIQCAMVFIFGFIPFVFTMFCVNKIVELLDSSTSNLIVSKLTFPPVRIY